MSVLNEACRLKDDLCMNLNINAQYFGLIWHEYEHIGVIEILACKIWSCYHVLSGKLDFVLIDSACMLPLIFIHIIDSSRHACMLQRGMRDSSWHARLLSCRACTALLKGCMPKHFHWIFILCANPG